MKLFDVRWTSVLADLGRWTALPLPARRIVLNELNPRGYVAAQRFGAYLDVIITSGISQVDRDRTRLWLDDERRELLKVLRAMSRHHVFEDPTTPALVRYMEEHFTNAEIEVLGSDVRRGGYATRHTLAPRVAFAQWAGDLLDAESDDAVVAWAAARGLGIDDSSRRILRNLQRLARKLLAWPDGVPLKDLVAQLPSDDPLPALAKALSFGLGSLVLFAGMRSSDLEPMVGLWPAAAHELTRPPARPPKAVVPAEQYTLALQMEDMTTLLAAVVAAPVRLRTDDLAVFARARLAIESRLVRMPEWAASLFANIVTTRVDRAARELETHGFAQVHSRDGNPHLQSTSAGAGWLTLSPHDRLASLLDPLRKSREVNPRGTYDTEDSASFFPFALSYMHAPKSLRLRDTLTHAFLGSADGFLPLEEFLDHAAREANPLQSGSSPPGRDPLGVMYYGDVRDQREVYRHTWRNMLLQFLVNRLIGLAGASIGRMDNGALCFALTDVGRYLLGVAERFEYGSRSVGEVVIQPNFDIVFLGTAPSTEATIARFAERVGVAPGLTFRITRKSVLGAAEAGATAEEVIGSLARASSKPVPRNVEREVVGWMAGVRRARLRVAQLIECSDEQAAARITTLVGAKARQITATIFELLPTTPSARAALVKKLRAGGVFLEDSTGSAASKPARGRRRERVRFADPEDFEDFGEE